jgi:hypothetical protein
MPVYDVIACALTNQGKTSSMEIRNYFKAKEAGVSMSKQAYFKQRKKMNYQVIEYLNQEYLKDFYEGNEGEYWHGYVTAAIDGSAVEIPNSPENREQFGTTKNQRGGSGARATISRVYEVCNQFFLDMRIDRYTADGRRAYRAGESGCGFPSGTGHGRPVLSGAGAVPEAGTGWFQVPDTAQKPNL